MLKKNKLKDIILIIVVVIVGAILGVVSKEDDNKESVAVNNEETTNYTEENNDESLEDVVRQAFETLFNCSEEDIIYEEAEKLIVNNTSVEYTDAMKQMCEQIRDVGLSGWHLKEMEVKKFNSKIIVEYTLMYNNEEEVYLMELYTLYNKFVGYKNYEKVAEYGF